MLTKFDEQAQKAIVVAESIAFDLGHNNVGSEHLLLSLLKISDCKLRDLVKEYGVNEKNIYEDIKRLFGTNDDQPFYMEYSELVLSQEWVLEGKPFKAHSLCIEVICPEFYI